MFGEEFGYAYAVQRHTELVQAAEHERLVRSLEALGRTRRGERTLHKRLLAATGERLVVMGCRLQQAAAQQVTQ